MTGGVLNSFEVKNADVRIRFSCIGVAQCISRAMENMRVKRDDTRLMAEFSSQDNDALFLFDGNECIGPVIREAVFFENTSYPTLIETLASGISNIRLYFSNSPRERTLSADDHLLYGAVSFGNQVGKTDICLHYCKDGRNRSLRFTTEVLSYKMDYRSDMKSLIRDIEEEYSMLSFAFMRETYLNFHTRHGKSTDLIWWQIFCSCYKDIVSACRQIINSPRRRLQPVIRHERAERLRRLTPDLENEYVNFRSEPNHLYRTEDLNHTDDTVENRFLKFVMNGLLSRFQVVARHIRSTSRSDRLEREMKDMEDNLLRMVAHPFFRNIGQFHGFAQDSLVMKRAIGYRTIYQKWIELLCGYELEEGIHKLETKDISVLYEIWCFIKVKNIVEDILSDEAEVRNNGKKLTSRFVRELAWGKSSEVTFVRTDDGVELASVMYNAPANDENTQSSIRGTTSFTTVQRPDIVLRLTKKQKDIQYTFLFDAKYRIADAKKDGMDVPPVDAIDQMHRYRDAIYYVDGDQRKPKREVIGGYVLFPGNYTKDEYEHSYYHKSIEKVGIGAFPLRPASETNGASLLLDPNDSELALHDQIETWLRSKHMLTYLYKEAIPQHGLTYRNPEDVVLVNYAPAAKLAKMKEKALCYVRTGEEKGAIVLTPNAVNVRYVMLHNGRNGILYRLKESGPRFWSKEDLEKRGFVDMAHEYYLVYELDTAQYREYRNVPGLNRGRLTTSPWFATWSELMGLN